jgi:GABA(A) receptor-associated protein
MTPKPGTFKAMYNLEQRKESSEKIRIKYPERVPCIVTVTGDALPPLDKCKYLVPDNLTVGQFVFILRKRIKLSPEKAIFIFVNKVLPPTSITVGEIYAKEKDPDGFLYFSLRGEDTFG